MKRLTPKTVLAAVRATMGNLSAAALKLGVARQSLHEYIQRRPELVAALQETRETVLDNVETVIYAKAMEGHSWAVLSLLKCLGKHRGWVERVETAEVEPVRIQVVEEIVNVQPRPTPGQT